MSRKPKTRALAALAINKLLSRKLTLTAILPDYLPRLSDKKDQAFLQELCYGVTRYYFLLEFILEKLLEKPLKTRDNDIKALLMAGFYQGHFLQTPPHAMVSASVDACLDLRKPWAKSLVNAILRKYLKEGEYLHTQAMNHSSACLSHPVWLLDMLKADYPDCWEEICHKNNQYPPMYLRVNTKKTSRKDYLKQLNEKGMPALTTPACPAGIKLQQPVDVHELPGFSNGYVSVQELAAQFVPQLMDLMPGQSVLDACAAPGGKFAHLLEYEPQLKKVVAVESDAFRFERLKQTLTRLELEADAIQADARDTATWWDGERFDRILLDAPCSATGVIRRHPDIKVLRTPESIESVAIVQNELLDALWPLLKSGGKLLYVTCSILKKENDDQIASFLKLRDDATSIEINADWGIKTGYGRQILPGQDDMDGFYYACLQKT